MRADLASPSTLRLSKYHGSGNDFLVLLDLDGSVSLSTEQIRALCHRRFGVGADGLLFGGSGSGGSHLSMELVNADGGAGEVSGNGVRCLVHAAVDAGIVEGGEVRVSTASGVRSVDFVPGADRFNAWSEVDMGNVTLGEELAVGDLATRVGSGPQSAGVGEVARELARELDGLRHACLASVGNPHLVLFGEPAAPDLVTRVGPILEKTLPGGVNVEFVATAGRRDGLVMTVWERGAGATLACGTGSCAAAAAARRWGIVADDVDVENPGGVLHVKLVGARATLSGATVKVAELTVELGSLDGSASATGRRAPT